MDNADGTITDQATGLMWMTEDSGKGMNWVKSSVNNQLSIVNYQLLFEAVLACTIAPTAAAAPVVAAKLGGNLSTITSYTLISSLAAAGLIPVVFPLLEPAANVNFLAALLIR